MSEEILCGGEMINFSKNDAEQALIEYIETTFSNFQKFEQKPFSRLLFQHIRSPFNCITRNGLKSIRVHGKVSFYINRNNINSPDRYHRRVKIQPDALYQSVTGETIIGEAKSSIDKTCFVPGSNFSCAHKIADVIINEKKQSLCSISKGFLKTFLSQSLGYIDAMNQQGKISTMIYLMQICPNSKIDFDVVKNLYELLVFQINDVFRQFPKLLAFGENKLTENKGIFYLHYDVNPIAIPMICEFMAEKFTKKYLW